MVTALVAGLAGLAGLVLIAGAVWVPVRRELDRRADAGACWVTVLPPPQADPDGARRFWRHVTGLLLPPRWRAWLPGSTAHLVFEYRFGPAGVIEVGVWVPGTVPAALVASTARASWPGARTEITSAETTRTGADAGGVELVVVGGVLRLARPAGLPLDADMSGADPVGGLLAAPGLLGRGQWAQVQILARPVAGARLARVARPGGTGGPSGLGARLVVGIASGLVSVLSALIGDAAGVIAPGGSGARGAGRRTTGVRDGGRAAAAGPRRVMDRAADRAVAGKATGPAGYVVLIRYGAATPITPLHPASPHGPPGPASSGSVVDGSVVDGSVVGEGADDWERARARSVRIAHALASSFAAFGGHNHVRRRRIWRPVEQVLAGRRLRRGDLLSIGELAALAHLPLGDQVAGLRRAGAAAVAPPPQVPTAGPGVRPLGDSDALAGRPVGISVPDARHHLWIIGPTGAGKSTLLAGAVLADAAAGRPTVVLDPKGDLVTEILRRLPAPALRRTVVIDPDRPGHVADGQPFWPCLNPLSPHASSPVLGYGRAAGDPVAEHVVTIFSRVFSAAWGFRSEDLLRVACLTVRQYRSEVPSLATVLALLSDDATRTRLVDGLPRSSPLHRFWDWYESLAAPTRANVAAPLLNKLRGILLRPFAEHVLCGESTVDLGAILDHDGILLVRLPKLLGEDTIRLIGSLIVAQVWQTILTRSAIPENQRKDVALILDECHNFLHLPYKAEDMLAEARAFRLSMVLAHQHLAQLTPDLREGIASNARSKIIFRCAADDAARLAKHTLPEITAHDLAHLDPFHAAARVMAGAGESRPFTFVTRDTRHQTRPSSRPNSHRPSSSRVPGGPPCPTPAETRPATPSRRPARPARPPAGRRPAAPAGPTGPGRRPASRPGPGAPAHRPRSATPPGPPRPPRPPLPPRPSGPRPPRT